MIQNVNIMIKEDRLGWKHAIQPEVTIEMIQLIAGFKAFHSPISKTKLGIQDVISSYSFNQFFILNTPWRQK